LWASSDRDSVTAIVLNLRTSSLSAIALSTLLCPLTVWAQTAPAAPKPKPPVWTLEASNDFTNPGPNQKNQNEIDVRLTKQASLRSTVFFEFDQQNRWSDQDVSFAIGGGHAFGGPKRLLMMSGSVAVSPSGDNIPLRDYQVSGEYRFNARINPVAVFERQAFVKSVEVNQVTAGVKITPFEHTKTWFQPVYVHSWAFLRPGVTENGNAFGFDGAVEATPRVSLTVKSGYGHVHIVARQLTVVELLQTANQLTFDRAST
jgi:hypothetical protein